MYSHTTYGQLKTALALRLSDTTQTFWVNTELGLYLNEAIRTFGFCSGFWRERGTLDSSQALPFYDVNQNLSNGSSLILKPIVTDQQIIQYLQYHLLESASSQSSWTGTEMFTFNDLANAVQNRLNQFMSDTGCVVNRTMVPVISPPAGRETLDQSIVDVRRAAWVGASPFNYYTTLWRDDERLLTAGSQTWSVNPATPGAYSVMAPPPLQLQLAPIPLASGQLELLTVNTKSLNPAAGPTVLGIPDQLTPAIKWGALADLLGKDGPAMDVPRAQYCEKHYGLYVNLARLLPVVVHAEINGLPLLPCTLQELDAGSVNWENTLGTPTDVALAAPNLIALNPVPNQVYSVVCDVVRQPPLPANDSDFVQVGREQLDMILDYAEFLALFKAGGVEWQATYRAAQNFMVQSLTYNQRLSAAARASLTASEQSQKQKREIPRRLDQSTKGVGSLDATVANG